MARADIMCASVHGTNYRNGTQSGYAVQVGTAVYIFYVENSGSFVWAKSTDGGITWNDPGVVLSGVVVQNFTVWPDIWTPGNAGTLIHLAYIENTNDTVFYRALDTSGDTLGTETTIEAITSAGAPASACIALTRAIGGNLYCLYDTDGGTEIGFARSTDVGATWDNTRADTAETADYYLLAPGFAADNQDIICIFWDRSASEISRKLYDNSGDSWSESSISTGMTAISAATATAHFSITVDDANNKILLIAWTNRDTANADLKFWSIDESAITAGTDVVLNGTDDQTMCALAYDSANGDLYAFYGGKSDGTETVGTAINIYYKISTDDGATWGSETQLSQAARNFDALFTSPIFTGDLVAIYLAQQAVANDYILVSAELPSGGGGVAASIFGGLIAH